MAIYSRNKSNDRNNVIANKKVIKRIDGEIENKVGGGAWPLLATI